MNDFFSLESLPRINPSRITLQCSSYDRKYENGDFNQFLYEDENGEMVLFEDKGMGVIKSIWAAVVTTETKLSFRFGDENIPRYSLSLYDFFNGGISDFSGAANTFEERGHYDAADCRCGNFFYPIVYTNGLKITASGKTDFYYHIMYEKYIGEIEPGSILQKTDMLEAAFKGEYQRKPEGETVERRLTLNSGYNTVFSSDKSGVITEFTVICNEGTDISPIQADISWDGERISQVSSPLSHLFANPLGFTEVNTAAVFTHRDSGLDIRSLYLPMPYFNSTSFCFVNLSDNPIDITLRLKISKNNYDKKHTGYFCADYRGGKTELFADWKIDEINGNGHVIGLVQTCHGGAYCEGNEHFYIDGCRSPQINGTGTEDLYLACYWPNLKFDSPVAGCVNDVYLMNDSTLKGAYKYPIGYYRYFLDMPISFRSVIRLAIQHGAVSQTYSDYTTLCLSYKQSESLLEEIDYINLQNSYSTQSHSYTGGEKYEKSSKLLSDMKAPVLLRKGYKTDDGQVSFTVAAGDGALLIRRLYDTSNSPQTASVFVDDNYVGDWHNPDHGEMYSFAESDFYIPAEFVRAKRSVKITMNVNNFTDFEYRVFLMKSN